jgi:hypothetical protein
MACAPAALFAKTVCAWMKPAKAAVISVSQAHFATEKERVCRIPVNRFTPAAFVKTRLLSAKAGFVLSQAAPPITPMVHVLKALLVSRVLANSYRARLKFPLEPAKMVSSAMRVSVYRDLAHSIICKAHVMKL